MPTSRPNSLSHLCQRVLDIQPKSILDVGCGFGSKGVLFREYTDIWNLRYDKEKWETRIDGVEIFEKYICSLQKEIYDKIYIGDILTIDIKSYDLIYLGDVLEHFTTEDGKKLLEKLILKSKHLIIATPLKVFEQSEILGNIYETHKSQWTPEDFVGASVKIIDNVIFAEYEKKVYYCEAMKTFGEKIKMPRYNSQTDIYSPVFFQGLYFEEDYQTFLNHKGIKQVFWNGSDVLRMLYNPNWIEIIRTFKTEHTCHNKQLQDELASVGIRARIKPIFFSEIEKYPLSYVYSETPQVYMTCNDGREEEYGVNQVLEIAEETPDIKFHIFGINGQNTDNVIYHGWVEEDEMINLIKNFQSCLRRNKHDGFSQTVMKSILMGQYPIVYNFINGVWQAQTKEELKEKLKLLKEQKEPNFKLREKYLEILNS